MARIVTRTSQQTDILYLLPDGTCFVTPDGEGRLWYDSQDEATEDVDFDRIVHVDKVQDW